METSRVAYRGVSERVSDQGDTFPDAVAARCGDVELSYADLNIRSDRFASYLVAQGVQSGDSVALCMERSFDCIIAALGIMRAGAAYVPLDPVWPDMRLQFALEDSGSKVLVAPKELIDRLGTRWHGIDPDRDAAAIAAAPRLEHPDIAPESLAYVIYTSGSSGVPKGVEITHANLSHLIEWHVNSFGVTRQDRASHLAGLGFDASVWELWPHLSAGAAVCLVDSSVRSSPELIQQWMVRERVTIGFVPTVFAAPMMAMQWPATELRFLLTGGDALLRGPDAQLPFAVVNNYGPTECTVVATSSVLAVGSSGPPPIGRAIAGACVYLLDDDGRQVADGELGEIYVGGGGVGRGYRNLPDATERSFRPDPFSGAPGARMYRTGDRGVRRPNGEVEFRGRQDRQAKIRGQRVELDEIGSVLSQHPDVAFAVAVVDTPAQEDSQLLAYVLPRKNSTVPTVKNLQEHLLRSLPHFMVPAIFVRLSSLPLSSSGKLDLKALPKPTEDLLLKRESSRRPSTPVEEQLLGLVRELLKNNAITAEDNFFLAGGHSLLGMQLILRVRNAFGIDLSLRQLFEAPTVEHLALLVEMKLAQEQLVAIWRDLLGDKDIDVDVSFFDLGGDASFVAGLQRRIIAGFGRQLTKSQLMEHRTVRLQAELLHGRVRDKLEFPSGVVAMQTNGIGNGIFWLHYPCPGLAKALGEDRPFLYLTLTDEDLKSLGEAPPLQDIAANFLGKILETQPTGPYTLGGFCLGGMLAYEVASQLRAAGHEVSLLALLDTPSTSYYESPQSLSFQLRSPQDFVAMVARLGMKKSFAEIRDRVSRRWPNQRGIDLVAPERDQAQLMIEAAAARYHPEKYEGQVALILAEGHPAETNFLSWWQSLIPQNLHVYYVPGQHLELVEMPIVEQVAKAITPHLNPAQSKIGPCGAVDGDAACRPKAQFQCAAEMDMADSANMPKSPAGVARPLRGVPEPLRIQAGE